MTDSNYFIRMPNNVYILPLPSKVVVPTVLRELLHVLYLDFPICKEARIKFITTCITILSY